MALLVRWVLLLSVVSACGEAPGALPELAGSQWRFPPSGVPGADPAGNLVTFFADGTAQFGLPTNAKGRWSVDGDEVVFDCNAFTEFRVVIDGDRMEGKWRRLKGNEKGLSHPTSLQRAP